MYIVRLEIGVWLAEGKGEPCRATTKSNAKRFTELKNARAALAEARKYRPFVEAWIIELNNQSV